MYSKIYVHIIGLHHQSKALRHHRAFISYWDMQPDHKVAKASRIMAYNILRRPTLRNRISIFSRNYLQQIAHSVPFGPVRLLTCLKNRARALLKAKFISGGASCLGYRLPEARDFVAF
jgi:hypothetical protein